MPDITMQFVPWPAGTQVGVYPRRSELRLEDQPPPMQPLIATAAVQPDATLTYVALDPDSYWAVAPLGGIYRYLSFEVEPLPEFYGPPGPPGPPGQDAESIDVLTMDYTYNVTITPPSGISGQLRFNHSTPSLATKLYLPDVDAAAVDWGNAMMAGDYVTGVEIEQKTDTTRWMHFDVTGRTKQLGSYIEFDVVYLEDGGVPLMANQRHYVFMGRVFDL